MLLVFNGALLSSLNKERQEIDQLSSFSLYFILLLMITKYPNITVSMDFESIKSCNHSFIKKKCLWRRK